MLTYKDSGVNIDEGNALVDKLKLLVKTTFDTNVIGGLALFLECMPCLQDTKSRFC
ncbi:phosphoribosylaminoimidazole synthetase [Helicobacter fennelliae]|nr:phosphoribosylaminoimidazole synthetase [Helicobacter fennelliae]